MNLSYNAHLKRSSLSAQFNYVGEIVLDENIPLYYTQSFLSKWYTYFFSGYRMIFADFLSVRYLTGIEQSIFKQLHALRSKPENNDVTTGGHFLHLYIRNMRIFYVALLYGKVILSKVDWKKLANNQLQTITVDLLLLEQTKKTCTTFMPLRKIFLHMVSILNYMINMEEYSKDYFINAYCILVGLLIMNQQECYSEMVYRKRYSFKSTLPSGVK